MQQSVSDAHIVVDDTVAMDQNMDACGRKADVGLLLQRVAVVGSGVVKVHQIGLHLVGKHTVFGLSFFLFV